MQGIGSGDLGDKGTKKTGPETCSFLAYLRIDRVFVYQALL